MTEQEKIRDNLWRTYPSNNPRPITDWAARRLNYCSYPYWVMNYNTREIVERGGWGK